MRITAAFARVLRKLMRRPAHLGLPESTRGFVIIAVLSVMLVGIAGVGAGNYLWWRLTSVPEGAALSVGDRVVTVSGLDRRVESLRALYGVEAPADDHERMNDFRRDSAKAFAVGLVLEGKAREMDVAVSDTTARKTLDEYIGEQFGAGHDARDQFVAALGNVGASEREVLDEIKQQLAVSLLFEKVTRDVTVSGDELRESFPDFRDRLGEPEKRRLLNIVVTSQDQAKKLVGRLEDGAGFADLARRYSVDGSTRDDGGDLGAVAHAQLEDGYGKAAFAARAGEVYGPVHNKHGWNVGQVVKVTPGEEPEFADVQQELRVLVKFDKQLREWQEWLTAAIEEADVRYADQYRPDDPYSVPTNAKPGSPDGGR